MAKSWIYVVLLILGLAFECGVAFGNDNAHTQDLFQGKTAQAIYADEELKLKDEQSKNQVLQDKFDLSCKPNLLFDQGALCYTWDADGQRFEPYFGSTTLTPIPSPQL